MSSYRAGAAGVLRPVLAIAFSPGRTGQSATSRLTCADARSQKASSLFPPGRGTPTMTSNRSRCSLFRESPPGRELAGHQCTHLGGCGRAWIAAHALELVLHVGN